METVNSKKMSKQPLVWRKAAIKETPRGWTWMDVVFYPIHSMLYILNKNPSILVDEFIMGANPILNLLLLHKLSKECVKNNTYKKVAIFFVEQSDYWAYDIIQNPEFFAEIEKIYGIRAKTIEELIFNILNNISREYLEVYIIKDDALRINYYSKDDYVNGWIFHFLTKKESVTKDAVGYIKVQNDIRTVISTELIKELNKNKLAKKVKWLNMNDKHYPIVMTKELKITSLPQGWINIFSEEKDDCVYFSSEVSDCSFGSAVCIPTKPEKLRENSLKHLKV